MYIGNYTKAVKASQAFCFNGPVCRIKWHLTLRLQTANQLNNLCLQSYCRNMVVQCSVIHGRGPCQNLICVAHI